MAKNDDFNERIKRAWASESQILGEVRAAIFGQFGSVGGRAERAMHLITNYAETHARRRVLEETGHE